MYKALKQTFNVSEYLGVPALRAYVAEFFGMLFFLFVGVGTATSTYSAQLNAQSAFFPSDPLPEIFALPVNMVLMIGLAFGIAIMVLVYSTAHISGGHLNPAVTMAMIVFGEINAIKGVIYIIVQTLGASTGVALVKALWSGTDTKGFNLATLAVNPSLSIAQGFFLEFIGTALLVFVIFSAVVDKKGSTFVHHMGPMAIGFTVFIAHLTLVPMTGCGINPARAFGSAAVSHDWTDQWLYWVAPLIGGPLGGALSYLPYQFENNCVCDNEETAHACTSMKKGPLRGFLKEDRIPTQGVEEAQDRRQSSYGAEGA
eukprot:CFRG7869T1